MMKLTKKQVYEALEKEFIDALPEIAKETDVSIAEASCDKWSKDYNNFHELENEEFDLNELIIKVTFGK